MRRRRRRRLLWEHWDEPRAYFFPATPLHFDRGVTARHGEVPRTRGPGGVERRGVEEPFRPSAVVLERGLRVPVKISICGDLGSISCRLRGQRRHRRDEKACPRAGASRARPAAALPVVRYHGVLAPDRRGGARWCRSRERKAPTIASTATYLVERSLRTPWSRAVEAQASQRRQRSHRGRPIRPPRSSRPAIPLAPNILWSRTGSVYTPARSSPRARASTGPPLLRRHLAWTSSRVPNAAAASRDGQWSTSPGFVSQLLKRARPPLPRPPARPERATPRRSKATTSSARPLEDPPRSTWARRAHGAFAAAQIGP